MDYCSESDLYAYGLPRGSIPNRGRTVDAAVPSTNTIPLGGHGFSAGDQLTIRPDAGGSMPAPLVANTAYYARPVNGDAFEVSATSGGAAIDITTAGLRFVVIAPVNYAASISYASRLIDEMLVGNVLIKDGDPVPEIVRMTAAEIAIGQLALISGSVSKSLGEIVDQARKRLDKWATGVPLRAANAPAAGNVATASAVSVPYRDSRGWNRFGAL